MKGFQIAGLLVAAAIAVAVAMNYGDLVRYLKIERM